MTEFQEETNCSGDDTGPLAPCFQDNGGGERKGARISRSYGSYATRSGSLSKRESKEMQAQHGSGDRGAKTRRSIQVNDELDRKWADAAEKFRCDGCEKFVEDDAMVFVLENKKAVCSKCAVARANSSKNAKTRSFSQMLLQNGQADLMLIRDAKQIANAVVRAGDFTSKRRSLPMRRPSNEVEGKSGSEDEAEEDVVRAPVYNSNSRRQLPRTLGADSKSGRRKVRRASEPLAPIQRPKFDNILMETTVVSDKV